MVIFWWADHHLTPTWILKLWLEVPRVVLLCGLFAQCLGVPVSSSKEALQNYPLLLPFQVYLVSGHILVLSSLFSFWKQSVSTTWRRETTVWFLCCVNTHRGKAPRISFTSFTGCEVMLLSFMVLPTKDCSKVPTTHSTGFWYFCSLMHYIPFF